MAKNKHHQVPQLQSRRVVRGSDLEALIASAKDERETPATYSNHVQLLINQNEIFIDFYRIEPSSTDSPKPNVILAQRTIVPLGIAKGFATAMANLVDGLEKELGIVLPNNRKNVPTDTIKIWEDQ